MDRKAPKGRQLGDFDEVRTASDQTVPRQCAQAVYQSDKTADDKDITTLHGQATVADVPTKTCSYSCMTFSFSILMPLVETKDPMLHGSDVPSMRK